MSDKGASYREIYEIFNRGFDRLDKKLDDVLKMKSEEHGKIHSRINVLTEEISSIKTYVQLGSAVIATVISVGISFITSLFKKA